MPCPLLANTRDTFRTAVFLIVQFTASFHSSVSHLFTIGENSEYLSFNIIYYFPVLSIYTLSGVERTFILFLDTFILFWGKMSRRRI